jgi:hypothetical protein
MIEAHLERVHAATARGLVAIRAYCGGPLPRVTVVVWLVPDWSV